jgi:exosortase A
MSVNTALTHDVSESKASWVWHIGALSALLALIVSLFWTEVSSAVEVWWIYPTYSHCFLVLPISAWLIWEKRDELRTLIPALAAKALFAVPFVLAIWLVSKIATINEVRQFAVIALVQIVLLTMLGMRVYRVVLFPALFLFFLVPVGQYLVPPMQRFATWFTDAGLTLLGIVHYTEGTIIQLTTGVFEIAEACAGLRFLIATVTLGVLFAHLSYQKWWKVLTFLLACVIVPLIGNGLRCIGIIVLAHVTNSAAAVEADHIIYGWGFNVAILLMVFFIGSKFRDAPAELGQVIASDTKAVPHRSVLATAVATALLLATGPALAYWNEKRPVASISPVFTEPFTLNGWTVLPSEGSWRPAYANPDYGLEIRLSQQDATAPPVDLAIVYYARTREGRSLIAGTNQLWDGAIWQAMSMQRIVAKLSSQPLDMNETMISSRSGKRLIWSVYWMDERFTTSNLTIKLLQIKTAFTGGEASALVAFSSPIDGAVEDARDRIRAAVASLDLPQYLRVEGREPIVSDSSD